MISGKKIYYVPGLISALLIPVLSWYFGNQKHEEINISILEFGIPSKYDPKIPVDQQNNLEHIRNWSYQQIEVKPNEARRNSKFYISEIKRLKRENKKESGIEFILNDENTYDDFISLLNDMQISNQERYGVDLEKTGHLFAIVNYQDPNIKEMDYISVCGGVIYNYVEKSDYYKGYTKFKSQLSQLPQEAFYLIFGFLIFLNISMFSVKERFLN